MVDEVRVERRGRVTIVTINRPARRNAVDAGIADALRAAFEAFEADDGARVAILTGAGGVFCAGYDLHGVAAAPPAYDADGPGPMGPTRMLPGKPVIAAVKGYAVAGGLELALWCDLRVAGASAVFGVFCRRWGVPLVDGGTVRLPRIVGQGRALDMILTGRPVDAAEASAIGLANRVVPVGGALDEAVRPANAIADFPQGCTRADRLPAFRRWNGDLPHALREEAIGGEEPLRRDGVAGAGRFAGGAGRAGAFDDRAGRPGPEATASRPRA